MAMFGNFDFGKGLKKQAEAFSRSPVASRSRKHPQLVKQLDAYASKLLYTVITHSAQVNPGQLRTGSEALVEVSILLSEPVPAYRTFAELVSRSRKVPAVPQLAQLVDKLLELPTDMKKERTQLLTYRIVTGTLSSERYLAYLRERAHLTNESSDWKDYALGVARLIRDGVVQSNDDLVGETLQDLVDNKKALGDQAIAIQQMLAESMLQRRNTRQAEFILVEAAVSGSELPDSFHDTVEAVLNSRPECCWELHQLVLNKSLVQFEAGDIDWPSLLQRLMRAKLHEEALLTYLVEHPLTSSEGRLGAFVRQGLQNLPDDKQRQLIDRFVQLVGSASEKEPIAAATSKAPVQIPDAPIPVIPPPPLLGGSGKAEPEPIEYLVSVQADLSDATSLRNLLRDNVILESLDLMTSRAILRQLSSAGLPEWAPLEARVWLVEQLTYQEKERNAAQLIDDFLQHATPREAQLIGLRLANEPMRDFAGRLRKALAGRNNAELWLRLLRLSLMAEDFRHAKDVLVEIPQDASQRKQAFAELEHWITRQTQPTPWMLITLSEARRDSSSDPLAGFDVATQAALIAPNDPNVQSAYSSWLERVPSQVVHERRLTQAMYLVTREERLELLTSVFAGLEIAHASSMSIRGWLDQLTPIVLRMRGVSRTKSREDLLRLFAIVTADEDFPDTFHALAGDLDPAEQLQLIHRLIETTPSKAGELAELASDLEEQVELKDRERVEAELDTARTNARPVRYSAGEIQPSLTATDSSPTTKPWRRALAVARRKRVAGDTDGAIRDLQAALEIDPQEAELSLELAEAFSDKAEYELARRIYGETQAQLGEQGNIELRLRTLYGLSTVIEHLERPAEAMHCLEELLVIRHDYRDSSERLDSLKLRLATEMKDAPASNIAANVILDEILELLTSRAEDHAEVSD